MDALYSLDLGSVRARGLVGEGLARATLELRLGSARRFALARLAAVVALLGLAVALGSVGGDDAWLAATPALAGFAVSSLCLLLALSSMRLRRLAGIASPFVDVVFTFAALSAALPAALLPHALAAFALGAFLAIVVFAALTLEADLIGAVTLLAFLCTILLQTSAGLPPGLIVASGIILGATAGVTRWGALRLTRLASRLVEEEVARRLAFERAEELERGSLAIATINAKLETQHVRLQLAQREAETMAGLLVHDMKQPLACIQGLVELVADELALHHPSAGQLLSDLAVARGQGERLLAMVADLLAISRLEQGAMTAKKQPTALGPLFTELLDAHGARAPGVAIEVGCEAALIATVDRELVQRLLENLFANAISFTRPGDRIELSARREGGTLMLAVKNSGPAVEQEARALLFEKLITRGSRARHNAGLGLYFCRLVAQAHQGRIALEQDPVFNVAFVVRLPADAPANTPPETGRLARMVRG